MDRETFQYRFARVGVCALALCMPVGAAAQAPSGNDPASLHLISLKAGREIASTALQREVVAADCSHLVHQVYQAAGYEYPYASSFDLYAGHDNFRRVRHPQPGDLIAWRGHVGIIVNPKQHTFYSLVRSGLQTEDYLSPYWRSRGTPRFYRFVLDSNYFVKMSSTARITSPEKAEVSTISEVEKDRRAPEKRTAAPDPIEPDPSAAASETSAEAAPALNSIPIPSERARPTSDEVLSAVASLLDQAANTLRTGEPLRPSLPIVIYDDLKVDKLELKRDKGWAHLKFSSHVRIARDGPDFKRRQERVKWELQRSDSGWRAFPPQDSAFISRDAAVRVLSAQLAEMAQSDAAARHDEGLIAQEARIANLIGALLTN